METDPLQGAAPDWRSRVRQCHAQGDTGAAIALVLGVLAADADDRDAAHALAVLYLAGGRADEAVAAFRALLRRENSADRHFDLAVALEAANDFPAARASYAQALALDAQHFKARLNLCAQALRQGLPQDALAHASRLVNAHPLQPDAWCALGHARFADADPLAADAAFARAQTLSPGHLPAAFGRVVSLAMCGQLDDAQRLLAELKALRLPAQVVAAIPQAQETLNLSPTAAEDIFLTALFERYRHGEWACLPLLAQQLSALAARVRADSGRPVPAIHAYNALAIGLDYADYRSLARQVAAREAVVPPLFAHPRPPAEKRRLRLAYLSPAFRDHPSAYLFRNVFRQHDRTRFSVSAYCLGADDGSAVRRDIVAGCDHFVSLAALNDRQAAQRIHDDSIDILVQFGGFFDGTRNGILQLRPAPLRVAHVGVVGALDAPYLDYRFCQAAGDHFDAGTQAPGAARFEKRVRFADLYWPYGAPLAPWTMAPTRRDCGLPERAFVFCSFNTDYKINEELFVAWMEILRATPGSVLWLRASNERLWTRCVASAVSHGVAPERLIRAPDTDNTRHLARLRLADLFLDSFGYNAHTTALDALWMGLPVLTRRGNTPASSLSAVFLDCLGLPELITLTSAAYIEKAADLANDRAGHQAVVRSLMRARSTTRVFDTPYKVRLYEQAYEAMWARHAAGVPPADFDVPPLPA